MIAAVIVMKFGGTSVADADRIREVVAIVRTHLEVRPVVVASAHAGMTDRLLAIADAAPRGMADELVEELQRGHRDILAALELPETALDPLLDEVADLARGLRLVGGASPKAIDRLASYGERCSVRTLALALTAAGIPATPVDAFAAGLLTDSAFGRARPLPDDGRIARELGKCDGVPVVTGFLAADAAGNITTLGRDGSDYSAALFGAALDAAEIQIWKDVDGVRTADPRLVPAARPIRAMSYRELRELTSLGCRVVHPGAMLPAMAQDIPILVRNTRAPEQPGTRIHRDVDAMVAGDPAAEPGSEATAIAHRRGMVLVTLTSSERQPQHAFLAAAFAALAQAAIDVGPFAVSEGALTFLVERGDVAAVRDRLAELGELETTPDIALLGVVGRADHMVREQVAAVLSTLAANAVPVHCAGQGASGATVAAGIPEARLETAVQALHERFFAGVPS
ncbi:MAG: aspartate kinase [bacterium]|nr:aspartate kinase [bacterium]